MDKENKEEDKEEDFSGLAEMLGQLAKDIKEDPITLEDEFEYPMEITGIKNEELSSVNCSKTGSLVQIRPVDDEYEDKTFLGIYLGDMPVEAIVGLHTKNNVLSIFNTGNPAIFVPELKKIIFGYESWWGYIETVEELDSITDEDIQNVWYVKMLREQLKKD